VEANNRELGEIAELVSSGKVKPHVQKTYALRTAVEALESVERGHSIGKIVMTVQ
jgi:NADPH:quinone reductase-like Zn-dependent oxidoreductase